MRGLKGIKAEKKERERELSGGDYKVDVGNNVGFHRMTQRHPGLRTLGSRSRVYWVLAPLESSSSTIS